MALVEGTAALAVSTYMQATGVAATATSGKIIAVDFVSKQVIGAYAAAHGTTTAAVSSTIAAGTTISTGGVIIIAAAAAVVIAGIVAWWISQHQELETKGEQVTIYDQQNVTVTTADGTDFIIYEAQEWGYQSYNPSNWLPNRTGVPTSRSIDVTFQNGARLYKSDDQTNYYAPDGTLQISHSRVGTAYGAVILHPTNPNYCCISAARVSGSLFSYTPFIERDSANNQTWEERKALGIDTSNPTGYYSGWFNINQLFLSPAGYNGGATEDTGSPSKLPGSVIQIQRETADFPDISEGQEIKINTGASTIEVPNPDADAIIEYVNESIAQEGLEYAPSYEIEHVLNPQPNPNPAPLPVPVPDPAPTIPNVPIVPPALPPIGSASSGMVKLWNPTAAEMSSTARFMLSGDFIDQVVKLFADPADYMLSLAVMPVVPSTGAKKPPYIGNLPIPDVTMSPVTNQYATIDCGSVTVPALYGNFIDYETQVSIFVPFCGEMELNNADVIGSTLSLSYRVDLLTGTCTAMLRVQRSANGVELDAVLYQWEGNMAAQIPVRASSWDLNASGLLSGIISGATVGGAAGAAVGGAVAIGKGMLRPRITGGGSLSGNAGHLGIQTPFLIFNRPRVATPSTYSQFGGRQSAEVSSLAQLSGYTVINKIHLEGIPATSSELDEIETLLTGGVIL